MEDIIKHFENSRDNYNIEGEYHLEYYRNKYPNNYKKLKQHYDNLH